jgi:hypothetical protein
MEPVTADLLTSGHRLRPNRHGDLDLNTYSTHRHGCRRCLYRTELAAVLRTARSRVSPADVGCGLWPGNEFLQKLLRLGPGQTLVVHLRRSGVERRRSVVGTPMTCGVCEPSPGVHARITSLKNREEYVVPGYARLTGRSALVALADLAGASIAAGVIARRRAMVGLLERLQADDRAIKRMQQLRRRFGKGPVELVVPGRRFVVLLEPTDVGRVLAETPTPFDPASWEKRHALEKFQPHGVLVSRGPVRTERRRLNEAALDSAAPLHFLAGDFARTISEETTTLNQQALEAGRLDSADFTRWWWRLVRRIVLGEAAREDDSVTDDLWRLRKSGNWSFLGLPTPAFATDSSTACTAMRR